MINDADRYIWLIANMGIVEEKARLWNPSIDKPLLRYLQDFIDYEVLKIGKVWIEKQRKLLEVNS